ncbi:hypothetical protein A7G45_12915 [Mycolicibacterium llatzerense]|uniref:Uncharacterized protein n=1 Tax=Mycolicibacterium llatzerense TaxID=280871 RepID=A0A0D1L2K1_9MYCO|nr:hypothetical protein TL10_20010 [Mycolicibacterium llatzerense]MCT7363703.1 hypothetical protein [Mycolicibacterium llatzerense]MCT7367858.1 hypothetical protein [Mycolicibacterium llatzerense]
MAVRLTSIDYHDWRLLALDGLTEALQNDGLTEAEIAAASALVGSGYFGRSTAGLKDLLSTATIVSAA